MQSWKRWITLASDPQAGQPEACLKIDFNLFLPISQSVTIHSVLNDYYTCRDLLASLQITLQDPMMTKKIMTRLQRLGNLSFDCSNLTLF